MIDVLQKKKIQSNMQKAEKRVKYSDIVITSFAEAAKATVK